jgi:hypothetical protein
MTVGLLSWLPHTLSDAQATFRKFKGSDIYAHGRQISPSVFLLVTGLCKGRATLHTLKPLFNQTALTLQLLSASFRAHLHDTAVYHVIPTTHHCTTHHCCIDQKSRVPKLNTQDVAAQVQQVPGGMLHLSIISHES